MAIKESLILEIQAELGTVKAKLQGLINEFKEIKNAFLDTAKASKNIEQELTAIGKAVRGVDSAVFRVAKGFDEWTQRITFFYFNILAVKDLIEQLAEPIRAGFNFNATLENTKLAFAAILTSLGEIKEAGEEITDEAEKFNKALLLAEEIQKQLRNEAVKSVATYQELVEISQGILAPFLRAGGKLEELPHFAVLMANLVRTFQLPIEQAVQEARDILSGTITSDTQTARALGITNEDIQRWKEQGVLIEKLEERLRGISTASERLQNTWSGLLSNLQDAFELLASEAAKPLFEQLKQDLRVLLQYILYIDKATGQVRLNPEIVAKARELGDKLKDIYEDIKAAGKAVYEFAQEWGSLIAEIVKAYIAVKLFTKAASTVSALKNSLVAVAKELVNLKEKAVLFYTAIANTKYLTLFRAAFLGAWAEISYEAGKLLWKALDKATSGFITYLGQKFFLLIDRVIVEVRHLLGKLHLPGGLTDKEYEAELRRLDLIAKAIEEDYKRGVSAFEEQHEVAKRILGVREQQKQIEESIKQAKNELLNLEYQINQAHQADKEQLKEIEKTVKEAAKGYERWLRQLERLKDLANSVLGRVKQSYEKVQSYLFPKKVSIAEQIRNLFAQFRDIKAKLKVETDPAKVKELLTQLDAVREKAQGLMMTDKFKRFWGDFKNWISTHGGAGYADLVAKKFGLTKDIAEKVLTQNFQHPQELFKASFGQLFNVSDVAPKLQQNIDKQISSIQNALTQLTTLQNQLAQLEKGIEIPIRLVNIEEEINKLVEKIPRQVTIDVNLALGTFGKYREF